MNTNKKNLLNAPVIYCKICYISCTCTEEHNIHIASPNHITNKNNFINTINCLTDTKLNEINNIETIIKMNENTLIMFSLFTAFFNHINASNIPNI